MTAVALNLGPRGEIARMTDQTATGTDTIDIEIQPDAERLDLAGVVVDDQNQGLAVGARVAHFSRLPLLSQVCAIQGRNHVCNHRAEVRFGAHASDVQWLCVSCR